MKLFLSGLILFIVSLAGPSMLSAQKYGATLDTVNASENLIRYLGSSTGNDGYFPGGWDIRIGVKADSLSGSTNTAVIIEGAYAYAPNIWVPLTTLTVNGAASNYLSYTVAAGTNPARMRYREVGTGTQATKVEVEWFAEKRKNFL